MWFKNYNPTKKLFCSFLFLFLKLVITENLFQKHSNWDHCIVCFKDGSKIPILKRIMGGEVPVYAAKCLFKFVFFNFFFHSFTLLGRSDQYFEGKTKISPNFLTPVLNFSPTYYRQLWLLEHPWVKKKLKMC